MVRKVGTYILYIVLTAGMLLCLTGVAQAATSNIDPDSKWAWGTNTGWLNFVPTHGGVSVYADHLEGYAWGENIGWIRLGTYNGGGTHTYDNNSKDNYGVNRDSSGKLSGYAWGTNVGWINFSPVYGGVTIDPGTGLFDGYAWSENSGWIHFTTYRVTVGGEAYPVNKVGLLAPWLGLALLLAAGGGILVMRQRRVR